MEETQAVISGGEKEVSNPFLEKSAITYDKENEENRKQQEYIYTYSGDALDYDEVYKYTTKNDAKVVIVAGEHASGKTTLEVMMYRMFLEGKNNLLQFAGSVTMKGFQERSIYLLKKSGKEEADVERTSATQRKFLNLSVCNKNKNRVDLLFTDFAGELYKNESVLREQKEYFGTAENVILTIDGEQLSKPRERRIVFVNLEILIRQLFANEILTKKSNLYLVCTKYDKVKNLEKYQQIKNIIDTEYHKIQESYQAAVNHMELEYLSALQVEEDEERAKLERLLGHLAYGTDRKQNNTLEKFEIESVRLERQYDKFKAR